MHTKTPPIQIAHYFYCHVQLTKHDPAWQDTTAPSSPSPLPRISFAVPTGAMGHVTAGVIAALMGLPLEELLMATNEVGMAGGRGELGRSVNPSHSFTNHMHVVTTHRTTSSTP